MTIHKLYSGKSAQHIDFLDIHAYSPERYPFLLESLGNVGQETRVDVLLALPQASLQSRAGRLTADGWRIPVGAGFFDSLSAWAKTDVSETTDELPYCGGWFVLLGYEAAGLVEPGLCLPVAGTAIPDALAVRCSGAVVRCHDTGNIHIIAETVEGATRIEADLDRQRLQSRSDLLPSRPATSVSSPPGEAPSSDTVTEDNPVEFLDGVRRILDYLRAGDVFQVNLSRRWCMPLRRPQAYLDLYRSLRRHNPAPFAGLATWNGTAVLSSSPERLVHVAGGRVSTQPIAGTRPRDSNPERDTALRETLGGNLKERAEHLMLIDLERNDLGRVCAPGSVTVPELMQVHSHAHVHHIVSTVRGCLRADKGPVEALAAVFPGGTITGCPKVRAMQIIAELEHVGRGPYTGAMGYLSRCGRLDMNILIRTLVCADGEVSFRAGAGIVADSDPEQELAETRAKARGMLLALRGTV